MARSGSFGGGLSPFGAGTLGNLGQYDIGSDLADLSVYQTEIAWGNGQATDADYLAALRRAAAAADPGSQKALSAQNKVDDAVYRIGRSQAEAAGHDALIAFDQSALATMNPNNLRYRAVQDSLGAELAQRRSRDYGDLVNAYNDGSLPTQALLDWVNRTLGTISPDDPDYANWTNVQGDLGDRIVGEKDSAVYQDFQRGRMTSADFLTYITARRDSYSPASPKYADWAAKVEDATAQIKSAAQSKADSTFFALYEEGKKSDASYMLYLRRRIDGMTPDDPQRGEWQHRLNQAVFSLAEDKLRFDAERASAKVDSQRVYVKGHTVTVSTKATTRKQLVDGKLTTVTVPAGTQEKAVPGHWTTASGASISAAKASMGKLMDFYTSYRGTLNPGSAEWRTVTRSIDSLARSEASFVKSTTTPTKGKGGGGSAGTGAAGAAIGKGPALGDGGKIINTKYTLQNVLGLFAVNPNGKKKDVAAANKFLALNMATLDNALNRGDNVWLFQDPRTPGSLVHAQNPDGSPALDKNGQPFLVRGSAYLTAKNEAISNLERVAAANFATAAEKALAAGKDGDFASFTRRSGEALDHARLVDGQYRSQNWDDWDKATKIAVDRATMGGDYGQALNLATQLAARLAGELSNPNLDDTRRAHLNEIGQQLADNKIMPHQNPDGSVVEGALMSNARRTQLGLAAGQLNPGWHHVLKSNEKGQPEWGPVFDPKAGDGSWESTHVTVHTALGEKLVTGEATISPKASITILGYARTPEGLTPFSLPDTTQELTFVDEHGLVQRAYSIDGGQTWIRPGVGMPAPSIVLNANLVVNKDAKTNVVTIADADSGETILTQKADGSWSQSDAYFYANPGAKAWYGQAAWEQAKAQPFGHQASEFDMAHEPRRLNVVDAASMPMGAPNLHMTLAYASRSGVVNLAPASVVRADYMRSDTRSEARRAAAPAASSQVAAARRNVAGPLVGNVHNMPGRPTTARDINIQLPADTPARYEGYGTWRPPTTAATFAPSSVLPGLTPAYVPSLIYTPPPLPALLPATASATLPKTGTVAKPPAINVATHTTAFAKAHAASPPPPPPPVKTPTATPGVYRPGTTGTGPLEY